MIRFISFVAPWKLLAQIYSKSKLTLTHIFCLWRFNSIRHVLFRSHVGQVVAIFRSALSMGKVWRVIV